MSKLSRLPRNISDAQLDWYRQRFEGGDNHAVLEALSFCGQYELAMPKWLADAYIKAFHRYLNVETKTLCEAFGVARPKGFNSVAAKKRRNKGFIVYYRVKELHDAGEPVTVALFERVAKEEHVNRDFVAKRYYFWKKREI